ncbi:hypothetical protein D3C72_1768640 [compost metagenome]
MIVGDYQAATGELGAVAVISLRRNTRGVAQHIGDALGALVVHQLSGNDGDRLRCFTDRQGQFGGGAGHGSGVGAGVFRGFAEKLPINASGAQFHRAVAADRHQHIAAIALALGLQATALEQARQSFFHRVIALQPSRLAALGLTCIKRQGDVGTGGEQAQVGPQCPRRNLEVFTDALRLGVRRQQRQHR